MIAYIVKLFTSSRSAIILVFIAQTQLQSSKANTVNGVVKYSGIKIALLDKYRRWLSPRASAYERAVLYGIISLYM